jgi:hypothetical protein
LSVGRSQTAAAGERETHSLFTADVTSRIESPMATPTLGRASPLRLLKTPKGRLASGKSVSGSLALFTQLLVSLNEAKLSRLVHRLAERAGSERKKES